MVRPRCAAIFPPLFYYWFRGVLALAPCASLKERHGGKAIGACNLFFVSLRLRPTAPRHFYVVRVSVFFLRRGIQRVFVVIYPLASCPTLTASNVRYFDKYQDWSNSLWGLLEGWAHLMCGRIFRAMLPYTLEFDLASSHAQFAGPGDYLDFFTESSDFGLYPHFSRHPPAAAARLSRKRQSWVRIQEQVSGGVRFPECFRKLLFSLSYSIVLVTAVYRCMRRPRWRTHFSHCGFWLRNVESE